jgi:ubiquinone biosynthesis protein COQ9
VDTKEVSVKNKSTQSSKDNQQETSTITFQQEVQNLHNELSNIEMPTTTDKSGQIGIIFPEGTTDFSKFADTTAEQVAIDQLSNIKFSCKK